jgi:CheY-like chemotaxis protein
MPNRILIVDDDSSFRATASELLRSRGFEVIGEAADGAEAIEEAKRLQPDAILLDVHLPGIDGSALVPDLHGSDGRPRVLLTSSDPEAADEAEAERCGAVGFVPKTQLARADLAHYLRR